MKELKLCAAYIVALVNDAYGFTKDKGKRWCNAIPCIAQGDRIPLREAFVSAALMHDEFITQIQVYEKRLLEDVSRCPQLIKKDRKNVRTWLDNMHHILYGFAKWHAMAFRYSTEHDVGDGKRVRLAIETQDSLTP